MVDGEGNEMQAEGVLLAEVSKIGNEQSSGSLRKLSLNSHSENLSFEFRSCGATGSISSDNSYISREISQKFGSELAHDTQKNSLSFNKCDGRRAECSLDSVDDELCVAPSLCKRPENCNSPCLIWMPSICSRLNIIPVGLSVLEGVESGCLLIGVVSLYKRVHLYRYKF